MIDPTLTKHFYFDCPVDTINRKHRYRVYYKRKFLRQFSNISELMCYCNHASFSSYTVLYQYLGADNHYYTFMKEYLYQPDTQLLLFNLNLSENAKNLDGKWQCSRDPES